MGQFLCLQILLFFCPHVDIVTIHEDFCNTCLNRQVIFFGVKWFMLNEFKNNFYFMFRLLRERRSSDWIWVVYRTSLTRPPNVLRLTTNSQSQHLAHLSVEQKYSKYSSIVVLILKCVLVENGGFNSH